MQQFQAEVLLAECRRQRVRALRLAAVSCVLVVALVAAVVFAAITGRYHGPVTFLVPVLLVVNLIRLGQYAVALRKIRTAERLAGNARSVWGDR